MTGRGKAAALAPGQDPWPYRGTIRRSDGKAPFNHYLWPLHADWYWANHHLDRRFSSIWNFYVVALADGRWLSDGHISPFEEEIRFFPDRKSALRHSAAVLIRELRYARKWETTNRVSPEDYVALVTWVMSVVGRPAPVMTIAAAPRPLAAPAWADLPLFGGDRPALDPSPLSLREACET